ncbi:IclR family transcriptional regulator [Jannaschia seohaensis]|uniref:DNA-binding IclR family transcriptional regulator n=1 Tax=Jannaschia seohaensis TaxID=475081 RepID=A0A2Y9B1M5_9RHOB|nr:IclR family transcriptional regulator [Jannaschia seohaensis]PWJ15086.1 DNA-binding IclR family transcriptional regulator [Jannaschia seohaensis]SSA49935.1 DNA-binding transcriptional regulator, IclR family [Jannaschia seohaensis]
MNVQRGGSDGTVGKALEVLDRVAALGRPVRFSEVMDQSPYPKATTYRLLQTLTNQGMLRLDPDSGTYAPGMRLVRMAHAAWAQSSLAPIAQPYLDELSEAVGETVHLAQLDGAQVLYVDKRNATTRVPMYSDAGKVGPAYCTGVGKAMLAFLPEAELAPVLAQQSWHRFTPNTITTPEAMRAELAEIRAAGHAYDREEHEPGIRCIAMPVLSAKGRVQGAVSVTTNGPGPLDDYLPALRAAVTKISGDLRDWRFPDKGEE